MSLDLTTIISIVSSVAFAISEILPFIPIKSNGIIQSGLTLLMNLKKDSSTKPINTETIVQKPINTETIDQKLDKILDKLNKPTNTVIV